MFPLHLKPDKVCKQCQTLKPKHLQKIYQREILHSSCLVLLAGEQYNKNAENMVEM